MPKTTRKRQAPHERPYVSNLELRDALEAKMDTRELQAMERQIRRAMDEDAAKA